MFSQTTEYALRAVVWLADHPDNPLTSHEIATATKVPPDYLAKVMQALVRGGIVSSQRGKHGGFALRKPAALLTILEVVNAVDPVQRIRECPLKLEAHASRLCPLHRRLDDALVMIERAFAETTIADVLEDDSPSRPLCNILEAVHA